MNKQATSQPGIKFTNVILGLLVLQFILGMLSNLYAKIPKVNSWEVFHQFGFIAFHAVNGTLLLVLAFIYALKARKAPFARLGWAGLGSIIFAFACGEAFVFTQTDIYSFLMSLGFLGAFFAYARLAFQVFGQSEK